MHIFLTSRTAKELPALGYRMIETISQNETSGRLSSNPTRFHIGRPDFDKIFQEIRHRLGKKKDRVGVTLYLKKTFFLDFEISRRRVYR
jgi:hypothetical protein